MYVNDIKSINYGTRLIINQLSTMKSKTLERVLSEIIKESEANNLMKNGKNMIEGVSYAHAKHSETVDIGKMSLSSDRDVAELIIPEEIRKTADEKHVSMNKVMIESVEEILKKLIKLI